MDRLHIFSLYNRLEKLQITFRLSFLIHLTVGDYKLKPKAGL
jgi:hypothetical protein